MTADRFGSEENLPWLFDWYRARCNGVWEHIHGLRLERFDHAEGYPGAVRDAPPLRMSSGWQLTIELAGLAVSDRRPRSLLFHTTDGGWLTCSLTHERFVGAGDLRRVEHIVGVFRRWWMEPVRGEVSAPEAEPAVLAPLL